MKKGYWVRLGILGGLVVFAAMFFVMLAVFGYYLNYLGEPIRPIEIVYDAKNDQVVKEPGFYPWLKANVPYGKARKYFFADEEIEIVDTIANVAYKAKLYLPTDTETVKRYYQNGTTREKKLQKAIADCVSSAMRAPYKIPGYPAMTIRAISISNMNELCPIANQFGYLWKGDLEIIQCSNYPKDLEDRTNCMNKVKSTHY